MSDLPDRPSLLPRRGPRPAADEQVDPIDTMVAPQPAMVPAPTVAAPDVPAEPAKQRPKATASTKPTTSASAAPATAAARPGRPRSRDLALPFSTRLSVDVLETIDRVAAEQPMTIRDVVETAVRNYWGR